MLVNNDMSSYQKTTIDSFNIKDNSHENLCNFSKVILGNNATESFNIKKIHNFFIKFKLPTYEKVSIRAVKLISQTATVLLNFSKLIHKNDVFTLEINNNDNIRIKAEMLPRRPGLKGENIFEKDTGIEKFIKDLFLEIQSLDTDKIFIYKTKVLLLPKPNLCKGRIFHSYLNMPEKMSLFQKFLEGISDSHLQTIIPLKNKEPYQSASVIYPNRYPINLLPLKKIEFCEFVIPDILPDPQPLDPFPESVYPKRGREFEEIPEERDLKKTKITPLEPQPFDRFPESVYPTTKGRECEEVHEKAKMSSSKELDEFWKDFEETLNDFNTPDSFSFIP